MFLSGSKQLAAVAFQVGSTPEGVEVPKCVRDPSIRSAIAAQQEVNRATLPQGADAKWRFMWRIGQRPDKTDYAELNSPAIIPAGALSQSMTRGHRLECFTHFVVMHGLHFLLAFLVHLQSCALPLGCCDMSTDLIMTLHIQLQASMNGRVS